MGMCGNARSTDASKVIEGNFKSWLCLLPTFTDEVCPRAFIEENGLTFAHVPVDVSFPKIRFLFMLNCFIENRLAALGSK